MFSRISAIILLALPLACGDNSGDTDTDAGTAVDASTAGATDPTSSTGASDPTSSTGDSSTGDSSTGFDPSQLYGCKEEVFGAAPLAGPGYDAAMGGIVGPLQDSYVLHTTQIYIRPEQGQTFGMLAQAVGEEAAKTEGLIAFSVGSDNGCGVARTMGIWASEEAMYTLVMSEAHAKAMAATLDVSYTGRVTHWKATAAEANAYTWDVARAKIADVEPSGLY